MTQPRVIRRCPRCPRCRAVKYHLGDACGKRNRIGCAECGHVWKGRITKQERGDEPFAHPLPEQRQEASQVEAVAWQFRVAWSDGSWTWCECTETVARRLALQEGGYVVRPLYTHPISSAGAPLPEQRQEAAQVEAKDGFYVLPSSATPNHRLHLQIGGAIWRYVLEDAAPTPQAVMVPLTEAEAREVWRAWVAFGNVQCDWLSLLRLVERAHGIHPTEGERSHD